MAGALATVILQMRPVATTAQIAFKKVAKDTLIDHAKASHSCGELMDAIRAAGYGAFDVSVEIRDVNGHLVVEMDVNWHVSPQR